MSRPPRLLSLLSAAMIMVAACGPEPAMTPTPSVPGVTPAAAPSTALSPVPFRPGSWPIGGSACGMAGYTGRIGRIEALDVRTVRFVLCAPDGAFLARIAHPALGILEASTLGRMAADPGAARAIVGTGAYRIDSWPAGGDALLVASGTTLGAGARTPTVIVRWNADASQRTAALQDAVVDGIDAPGPADISRIETQPELALVPRLGLATAYLAFGADPAFDDVRVRRAIAGALDLGSLADTGFPPGSVPATFLAPCEITGACAGTGWYEFNAPASVVALTATGFDLKAVYLLHVPDRAIPGLPDPAGVAAALAAQLKANLGITVSIDVMDASVLSSAIAAGTLGGMYLGGVTSTVADPGAFLAPVLGPGTGTPAGRVPAVASALSAAAANPDPGAREAAFTTANDAIRSIVPLIPLVHPGSEVAYRADVRGVVASPLGIDPLGAFTPSDRPQLVFMQATDPGGAYCGDQASADALRICALVTDPLYGFAAGTLNVEPRLAERCAPNADATVWTCTLRKGATFSDGVPVGAGDVLATYVAQWDPTQPLRAARPDATFAAWAALFGGFLRPSGG